MSGLAFWHRQKRLDGNFQQALDELAQYRAAIREFRSWFEAFPPLLHRNPPNPFDFVVGCDTPNPGRDVSDQSADAKADALLGGFLTAQQGFDLANKAYFDVPVVGYAPLLHRIIMDYYPHLRERLPTLNRTRTYRIRKHLTYNVELLDSAGQPCLGFCAYPYSHSEGRMPLGDILLGQKLVLETDEAGFLGVANATLVR